jgi:hypothetical protein
MSDSHHRDFLGTSGLVIDNLSATWLFPASTQPFGTSRVHEEYNGN